MGVLEEMRDIVIKYRDSQGGVRPYNRIMYGVREKRGVAELMVD